MIATNKLIYGVGLNDADCVVQPTVGGKRTTCPHYSTWQSMLERCYSPALHARYPTYVGCSVTPEWHSFSTFRAWMQSQDWQGKHLDKDLLLPGNRIYGPSTCLFVSPAINSLLTDSGAIRGAYPLGVSLYRTGRFQARCCNVGRNQHLGYYDTAVAAHRAWQQAKLAALNDAWLQEPDPRICAALVRIAGQLSDDINADRETVAFGIVAERINAEIEAAVAKARLTSSTSASEAARLLQ